MLLAAMVIGAAAVVAAVRNRAMVTLLLVLAAAALPAAATKICPAASSTIHWLNASGGDFRITIATGSSGGQLKGSSWKGPLRLRLRQLQDCTPALELAVRADGNWKIVADQPIKKGSRIETPASSYFDTAPLLEVETIE